MSACLYTTQPLSDNETYCLLSTGQWLVTTTTAEPAILTRSSVIPWHHPLPHLPLWPPKCPSHWPGFSRWYGGVLPSTDLGVCVTHCSNGENNWSLDGTKCRPHISLVFSLPPFWKVEWLFEVKGRRRFMERVLFAVCVGGFSWEGRGELNTLRDRKGVMRQESLGICGSCCLG